MIKGETMKVKKPALLISIFLALYTTLPHYFQIAGIEGSNILVVLFGIYWLVKKWKSMKRKRANKDDRWLYFLFSMFIIIRLIVYVSHGEFSRAVVFFFSFVVLGKIIISYIDSEKKFYQIIDTLIYISLVVTIIGIIEAITRFNLFSLLNNTGIPLNYNKPRFGVTRILGFTQQTINYCLYCSIVACLVSYRLGNKLSLKQKRIFRITFVLLCINIALTLSRSIIICFVFSQLLMLYKGGFKKLLKYMFLLMIVFLLGSTLLSIIANTQNLAVQFLYMLLAVFDDSYALKLANNWGSEDKSGVGHRITLYYWVWESVKNKLLFGFGERSGFEYRFNATNGIYQWSQLKTSIEVNHLWLLYHYGIIDTCIEIILNISLCISSLVKSVKTRFAESKVDFNFTFFSIMIMVILSWFGVNSESEWPTLSVIWFAWLAYNNLHLNKHRG